MPFSMSLDPDFRSRTNPLSVSRRYHVSTTCFHPCPVTQLVNDLASFVLSWKVEINDAERMVKQVEFCGRELLKSRIKVNARFNAARNVWCVVWFYCIRRNVERIDVTILLNRSLWLYYYIKSSGINLFWSIPPSISSIEILIKKLFPRWILFPNECDRWNVIERNSHEK